MLDGEVLMPQHSLLVGYIESAKPVGVGLRRERSSLEVNFTHWKSPDGELRPLDARIIRVDNAREQVDERGRIQGILAASNPLGVTRGLWYHPGISPLSVGLGGSSGAAWMNLASGPEGSAGLFLARLLLTRLPDPEIHLPAGTEMTLQVRCSSDERRWGPVHAPFILDPDLDEFLRQQSTQIVNANKKPVGDIINVAFIGSAEVIKDSFEAAGWTGADPLNRASFARAYGAFTQRKGYPEAPVSKLYYQERLPDLVFQKSLNSIAKRHHIRLWHVSGPSGEDIWLGAATHDITVGFDAKSFGLQHKIDFNIDTEREKVMSDLEFAGASQVTAYVERTFALPAQTQTDSALAVTFLQTPSEIDGAPSANTSKEPAAFRFARRLVLETRNYVERDNPYYITYAYARRFFRRMDRQASRSSAALSSDASTCAIPQGFQSPLASALKPQVRVSQ